MAEVLQIPAGSFIQINVVYVVDGQTNINTFHYRNNMQCDDWYNNTVDALFTAFENSVLGPMCDCMTTSAAYFELVIQPIAPTRYRAYRGRSQKEGTVNGGTCPSTTAMVIQRLGSQANRKSMGRIFLGAVPSTWVTQSQVNDVGSIPLTVLTDAMTAAPTAAGVTFEPYIFNPASPDSDGIEVVYSRWQQILRVQRRREVGRGI